MSIFDLEKLSPAEQISQYIIEVKGVNAFLSYMDYEIIDSWLKLAKGNSERLLLILSEILPKYYQSDITNKNLSKIKKTVERKIKYSL